MCVCVCVRARVCVEVHVAVNRSITHNLVPGSICKGGKRDTCTCSLYSLGPVLGNFHYDVMGEKVGTK